MKKPTCENCPYWERRCEQIFVGDMIEIIGICRIKSVDDAEFPERYNDDWCGEHPLFALWLASTQKWNDEREEPKPIITHDLGEIGV